MLDRRAALKRSVPILLTTFNSKDVSVVLVLELIAFAVIDMPNRENQIALDM